MSYFPFVADENTNPTLRAIKDSFGFVPNYYRAQTMRPDLIDVEAQLVHAILVKEGALTRQQKEYIFLVCSAANLSTYCLTAHCEMVRMMGIDGPEPEQIAFDHTAAKIPVPLKALLNFAAKLNSQPAKITKRDVDVLRTYGYADQQIMEAVLMVGLAKFANFVAFGLGTSPDFDSSQKILAHVSAAAESAR
jgi:uncharacterized peroxidase-related enzyme